MACNMRSKIGMTVTSLSDRLRDYHVPVVRNPLLPVALAVLAVFSFGTVSKAQTIVTGEISGVVTDPSGAVVANVTVNAKSESYGDTRKVVSNQQGEYRVPLLPPGAYTVSATGAGFQPTVENVTVSLGQVTAVPIKLGLQQQTQTVNVVDVAPLLQNDNANATTNFSTLQLQSLPAPGNDITTYLCCSRLNVKHGRWLWELQFVRDARNFKPVHD